MSARDTAGGEAAESAITSITSYHQGLETLAVTLEKCYNECECDHVQFKQLRTGIMEYALVYRSVHLSASKVFLKNLSELMTYYSDLSFEEFVDYMPDILEAVAEYQGQAELVSDLHNYLVEDLHSLKQMVKVATKQVSTEHSDSLRKRDQLHAKADRHDTKAAVAIAGAVAGVVLAPFTGGLSLLATVGAGVGGVHHIAKNDKATEAAFAKARDAKDAEKAGQLISGPILQAVQQLGDAVATMAFFFQYIRNEMETYHDKAKTANRAMKEQAKKRVELHFKLMKKAAERVSLTCKVFLAKVPQFESYLAVLAKYENTTQSSYPQVWLKEKAPYLAIQMS